jgi:hypothetical protein
MGLARNLVTLVAEALPEPALESLYLVADLPTQTHRDFLSPLGSAIAPGQILLIRLRHGP